MSFLLKQFLFLETLERRDSSIHPGPNDQPVVFLILTPYFLEYNDNSGRWFLAICKIQFTIPGSVNGRIIHRDKLLIITLVSVKFEWDQDVQGQIKGSSAFTTVSVRSGTQCSAWGALISTQDRNFLSSLGKLLFPLNFFLCKMRIIISQR